LICFGWEINLVPWSNFGLMKRASDGIQLTIFEPENLKVKEFSLTEVEVNGKVKIRRLKIQYANYTNSYRRFPVIRLAGHWLSEFDFQIGDSIEIQMEKGQLLISKKQSHPKS
jgi:hypothetical protein